MPIFVLPAEFARIFARETGKTPSEWSSMEGDYL